MKLILLLLALTSFSGATSAQSKYALTDEQEAYVSRQEAALRKVIENSIKQERARKKFAYPVAKNPAARKALDEELLRLGLDPTLFVLSDSPKVDRGDARASLTDGYIYVSTRTVLQNSAHLPFILAHEYAHVKLEHPLRQALGAYRMAAMYCFKCVKGKDPIDVALDVLENSRDAVNTLSRKYELEADSWAVRFISEQGIYVDYLSNFSDPRYGCLDVEEEMHPSCLARARNAYLIVGTDYQHLLTNDIERLKVFQTGAFTID